MKIIQKVISIIRGEGEYHNFFFTPGSRDSMESMINNGWILKHINDDKENGYVCAVFEKEITEPQKGDL